MRNISKNTGLEITFVARNGAFEFNKFPFDQFKYLQQSNFIRTLFQSKTAIGPAQRIEVFMLHQNMKYFGEVVSRKMSHLRDLVCIQASLSIGDQSQAMNGDGACVGYVDKTAQMSILYLSI